MIRNWLRSWLGITDITPKPVLIAVERADMALARIVELEKELGKLEAAHSTELNELRERLEMPAKRKPSGRPFAVLAKIAEMGAQKQNAG